jgi:small GTP-binding protein
VYKIAFVGDADVGKTSIILRYITKQFIESPIETIGMSHTQIALMFDCEEFTVNVWDTAGQERYRSLVPLYSRGSHVMVIVFAVDSPVTFQRLDEWFVPLGTELQLRCPILVVANKLDLEFAVDRTEIGSWARERGLPIIMTSAKTGENIQQLFILIAELLANSLQGSGIKKVPMDAGKKKGGCC